MDAALGFSWNRAAVPHPAPGDRRRELFNAHKLHAELVWNTAALEGNPFTFPEVRTLLNGITVGGRKLADEQQVLNQSRAWKRLIELVQGDAFTLSKAVFCELNALVAFEEALTWGIFRDGAVQVADTTFLPPAADRLDAIFDAGVAHLNGLENPVERGFAFFLFGSLNQFFYDGNKRTSRLMANGVLLAHGYPVLNIPAARQLEFNEKMLRFYDTRDGTGMMAFLAGCAGLAG